MKSPNRENSAITTPPAHTPRGPISHLDFESKIENVYSLIRLLSSEPSYKPNEADLQITALTANV